MMDGKNSAYVSYAPSLSGGWTFTIGHKGGSIAETYDELIDIYSKVILAGKDFVTPTAITYTLNEHSENINAENMYSVSPDDQYSEEIKSSTGLESEYVINHIDEHAETLDQFVSINNIDITGALVSVILDNLELEVSRNTEEVYKWVDQDGPVGNPPGEDPVTVTIYRRKKIPANIPVYKVCIDIHSDIWYEDNEIGERNRELLARFLRRLYIAFSPQDVDFHAERSSPFDSFYTREDEEHDLPF